MGHWVVGYLGKRERAAGTKTFTFQRPRDLEYRPGQFLYIGIPAEGGTGTLRHHFSFSSSPTEPHVEFTTRLTGHTFKSRMDALRKGTRVALLAPDGGFVVRDDMAKVAFLAGGIGMTPVRSTIRWALDTDSPLDIVALNANSRLDEAPFREEFGARRSPSVRVVEVVSEPDEGWTGPRGHIDAAMVREQVPDWRERYFFVSGPPRFVAAMKDVLSRDVGVRDGRLVTEHFLGYE